MAAHPVGPVHDGGPGPRLLTWGLLVTLTGASLLALHAPLGAILLLGGVAMILAGLRGVPDPCPHCRTPLATRASTCPGCKAPLR